MDEQTRSKYVEYIASAVRYSERETGQKWPDETIILAKSYTELAGTDAVIGAKVYIIDMPSTYDFSVSFPGKYSEKSKLLKSFREFQELFPIEDREWTKPKQ